MVQTLRTFSGFACGGGGMIAVVVVDGMCDIKIDRLLDGRERCSEVVLCTST